MTPQQMQWKAYKCWNMQVDFIVGNLTFTVWFANNMHKKCKCLSVCLSACLPACLSTRFELRAPGMDYDEITHQNYTNWRHYRSVGFSYLLLVTRIEWSHKGYMGVTVMLFMHPHKPANMIIIATDFQSSDTQTLQNFWYILLYVFHAVVWFV
jgi:hypothetical protein